MPDTCGDDDAEVVALGVKLLPVTLDSFPPCAAIAVIMSVLLTLLRVLAPVLAALVLCTATANDTVPKADTAIDTSERTHAALPPLPHTDPTFVAITSFSLSLSACVRELGGALLS